mmetsp:Transcript_24150/g.27349  ORF Transcript_24150/g.27349 Transcript_24150/m.27349 type:complete len:108 (-) Transcript_24150:259-582(-)
MNKNARRNRKTTKWFFVCFLNKYFSEEREREVKSAILLKRQKSVGRVKQKEKEDRRLKTLISISNQGKKSKGKSKDENAIFRLCEMERSRTNFLSSFLNLSVRITSP